MSAELKNKNCGFTLIEALIAMVILGLAITALLVANQSFTSTNAGGIELSTAEFLIEQVRERSVNTGFASLSSLAGTNLPPKDSQGIDLTDYPGYSETITVQSASGFGPNTDFCKINVEIYLHNELISSASWLRAKYN
jgi:prepilin-type N-terminal cleavage/methylation domain-containing protein